MAGKLSATFVIAPDECEPMGEGGCRYDLLLVLNTFLLPDGPNSLNLVLAGCATAAINLGFTVDNSSGLGRQVAAALRRFPGRQWIWREGEVDASHFPLTDDTLTPWFDSPDARAMAPVMASRAGLDASASRALEDFVENGFCILPERVDDQLLQQLNDDLDAMLASGAIRVQPEGEGDHRIERMHEHSQAAREIWTLPCVIHFLRAVFQEDVLPCQTLVFVRGSGQDMHQDTIHLTAFPAGYMCGVWIALEDVKADAGPLFVYPRSHRLPRLYCHTINMSKVHDGNWQEFAEKFLPRLRQELESADLHSQNYLARKGDILVWHENLTHGGSMRTDPALTRRSIVSHYFSRGAAVWYDSSGYCGGTQSLPDEGRSPLLPAVFRKVRSRIGRSRLSHRLKNLWP
ncbi:MAG: phytanoyl-CoA dioxygenase family protein [Halioglobus sp.]